MPLRTNSFAALDAARADAAAAATPGDGASDSDASARTPSRRRRRARTAAPESARTSPTPPRAAPSRASRTAHSECGGDEAEREGGGGDNNSDASPRAAASRSAESESTLLARGAGRGAPLPTIFSPAGPPPLEAEAEAEPVAPAPRSPLPARPPATPPPPLTIARRPSSLTGLALYLHGELHPVPSLPSADVAWGQTERQRVHASLFGVPAQFERFAALGSAIAADAFLAVFTLLPLRVGRAAVSGVRRAVARTKGAPSPPPSAATAAALYDSLCVAVFAAAALALCAVPAGTLYFWMKDMNQEFLKLHVIFQAVELAEKVACPFAVDALAALSATCASYAAAPPGRARAALVPSLAADTALAAALVLGHGVVLVAHGVAFAVAMHAKRGSTLLALTIAGNFMEIKSSVFKRYDARKLHTLACQDVVERCHLALALAFVVVEAAADARVGGTASARALLHRCVGVLAAELAIDVVKHAVLARFNDVRPGVYREFTADLASAAADGHSHSLHRAILFDPLAPAALAARLVAVAAGARGARGAVARARRARRGAGGRDRGRRVVWRGGGEGSVWVWTQVGGAGSYAAA